MNEMGLSKTVVLTLILANQWTGGGAIGDDPHVDGAVVAAVAADSRAAAQATRAAGRRCSQRWAPMRRLWQIRSARRGLYARLVTLTYAVAMAVSALAMAAAARSCVATQAPARLDGQQHHPRARCGSGLAWRVDGGGGDGVKREEAEATADELSRRLQAAAATTAATAATAAATAAAAMLSVRVRGRAA